MPVLHGSNGRFVGTAQKSLAPTKVSTRFLNSPKGNASGRVRAVLQGRAAKFGPASQRTQRAEKSLGPLMRRLGIFLE